MVSTPQTAPSGPLFRFTFRFDGEAVIDREFAALESRINDVSPAWWDVVAVFRAAVNEAFATEGASTGVKWPALKLRTAQARLRAGFPGFHPILQRTGELKGAITGGGGGFVETTPTSLAIGTDDRVFWYHQSNKPRTSKLPRRAPVLLTQRNRVDMVRPIVLYLTGKGRFAGPELPTP